MRIVSIQLFLFLLTLHAYMASAEGSLRSTAEEFCNQLNSHDISHHDTKKLLEPFFKTDDDLSDYIVRIYYIMKTRGFRSFRIMDCKLLKIEEISKDEARVQLTIIGEWFLFFSRSAEITDIWKNENGSWYIFPPKTLKKRISAL